MYCVCVCVCDRGSRAAKWPQGRDVTGQRPRRMRSASKRESVKSARSGCWMCGGHSSWWNHNWKRALAGMARTLTVSGTHQVIWRRGTQPLEKSWPTEAEKGKFLNDWSRSGAPRLVTFKKTLKRKPFFSFVSLQIGGVLGFLNHKMGWATSPGS